MKKIYKIGTYSEGGRGAGRRGNRRNGENITVEEMALEYAGIVGCDPGPLTLRQLKAMALSRLRHNLEQTSAQMALAANIALAGRSTPYAPDHFNPYRIERKRSEESITLNRDEAIAVFKSIAENGKLT